jgi:hypothetical protein
MRSETERQHGFSDDNQQNIRILSVNKRKIYHIKYNGNNSHGTFPYSRPSQINFIEVMQE